MNDNQKAFLKQREKHTKGQFTEKRIHLSSRLPFWLQAVTPRVFYVTEKSYNFYPLTITGMIHKEVGWSYYRILYVCMSLVNFF